MYTKGFVITSSVGC